jgi:hypothetical protein
MLEKKYDPNYYDNFTGNALHQTLASKKENFRPTADQTL